MVAADIKAAAYHSGELIQREIFRRDRFESAGILVVFQAFKPQNWRERSAEARRRNGAVMPLSGPKIMETPVRRDWRTGAFALLFRMFLL